LGTDGSLYSQSYDGNSLWVRDVKDGHISRSVPIPFTMYSGVSEGASGNVYVGGATEKDHSIYALDKTSGAIKWQYATHYLTSMTPVEVNGTVYYGEGERLCALDPVTGKMKWSFASDAGVTQPPLAGPDGKVYVIDKSDTVYAIDPSQGKPDGSTPALWKSKLDVAIQNPDQEANFDASQPLLLTPDGLTAVANGQTIRQLDPSSGQKQWEIQVPIDGLAAMGPNGIYIGDGEGVLHVDPHTGQGTRWDAGDGVVPKDSAAAATVVQYGVGKVAGF
jgi:outer membrane protein assembly factor BamB